MGNNASLEKNHVDKLLKQPNPNIKEISKQLPNNREIRVKKIYHVNKPLAEEPIVVPPPPPIAVIQPAPVVYRVPIAPQEPPRTVVYAKNPNRFPENQVRVVQAPGNFSYNQKQIIRVPNS